MKHRLKVEIYQQNPTKSYTYMTRGSHGKHGKKTLLKAQKDARGDQR